jgi:hypothetical protein
MDSHIIVIKLVPGFSDEAIMAIIQYGPHASSHEAQNHESSFS